MAGCLTLLMALLVLMPLGVAARGQADGADPVAAELARYPELVLRVTGETIEAPREIAAGRYHLIQENATAEQAHFFMSRVPDDVSDAQLDADLRAGAEPGWFARVSFAGNPDRAAANGGRAEGIVDLPAGRYVVVDPLSETDKLARFDVAAGAATPTPDRDEPVAAVRVDLREMAFDLPATIPAGRALWRVHNAGALPHEMAILPVPTGATTEQTVAALLALFDGGDPARAAGPAWAGWQADSAGGMGVTSPQRVAWSAIDLAPGTYAAVCFAPFGTDRPHLMDGMAKVFTVE